MTHGFWSRPVGSFLSFLPFGQYNMQYYLVLPLAYGLLLLGGWLLWRGAGPQLARHPAGCSAGWAIPAGAGGRGRSCCCR